MEKQETSSDKAELEEDFNVGRVDGLPLLDLLLPVHLLLVLVKVEPQRVAVVVQAKHPGLSSRESGESHHQQLLEAGSPDQGGAPLGSPGSPRSSRSPGSQGRPQSSLGWPGCGHADGQEACCQPASPHSLHLMANGNWVATVEQHGDRKFNKPPPWSESHKLASHFWH